MDATERRNRATDEASYWWHRLGTQMPENVSEADREQFTRWLRESPVHVAELLHVAHVHDALERFKLWKEIAADGPEENLTTVVSLDAMGSAPRQRAAVSRKRLRSAWGVAAGIAVIALATGWAVLNLAGYVIVTDRAERREVMLDDGTIVKLEPETEVRILLQKHERHVSLERGRVLFHVAKDPQRPFLVEADNALIRAVGTAFGVERKSRSVIVTVAEGKVAVTSPSHQQRASRSPLRGETSTDRVHDVEREIEGSAINNPGSRNGAGPAPAKRMQPSGAIFLTAGKQLTVQNSGSAEPVRDVDTARALAWAEGRLVFDAVPLAEVAQEFNRYNHVQLRVDDPQLARRPVSGVFQASDLETLVGFIRAGARVEVIHEGTEQILIAPVH